MRRTTLKGAQSVRFDVEQSPDEVNGGQGWNETAARRWLTDNELVPLTMTQDACFLRFKLRPVGTFRDVTDVDDGVAVIRCDGST